MGKLTKLEKIIWCKKLTLSSSRRLLPAFCDCRYIHVSNHKRKIEIQSMSQSSLIGMQNVFVCSIRLHVLVIDSDWLEDW